MITALFTVSHVVRNVAWEARIERKIIDPLRSFVGMQTSSQLIAQAFNEGIDDAKYQALMEDLELMHAEIVASNHKKICR